MKECEKMEMETAAAERLTKALLKLNKILYPEFHRPTEELFENLIGVAESATESLVELDEKLAKLESRVSNAEEYVKGLHDTDRAILLALDQTDVGQQFDDAMTDLTREDGGWTFNELSPEELREHAISEYMLLIRSCVKDMEDGRSPDDVTKEVLRLTEEFRKDVIGNEGLRQ